MNKLDRVGKEDSSTKDNKPFIKKRGKEEADYSFELLRSIELYCDETMVTHTTISVVLFNFMVQEPREIILCAKDRSLFSRLFM